ncbi:MAG: SWIM zinc finger family protein [Rhodomicrobium sp.]|nr:SWIM zinc finger family protein [Rhodomicrobium sp.]
MGASLTRDKIAALAPDQSALTASIKLQKPASWPMLGRDSEDTLIWGECQGSGAAPYRVMADLRDLGNKCICPSRKFPCKHVLALFWLSLEAPGRFAEGETPLWVGEWLARRRPKKAESHGEEQSAASKGASFAIAESATLATAKPVDPKAAETPIGGWYGG